LVACQEKEVELDETPISGDLSISFSRPICFVVKKKKWSVMKPNSHETSQLPFLDRLVSLSRKRAITLTLQAANRYVENLAIVAAWEDMQQDIMANNEVLFGNVTGGMAGNSNITPTPDNSVTETLSGTLSGRGFTISWSAGDVSSTLL
jgi:hypothetical protein